MELTPLEAWRFLPEATTTSLAHQSQTFEGFYSWDVLTLAYAQNEWSKLTPWNAPHSKIIQAGKSTTFGLKFSLATKIRSIDSTVETVGIPSALGIPGFTILEDMEAKLYRYFSASIPFVTFSPANTFKFTSVSVSATNSGHIYTLLPTGSTWVVLGLRSRTQTAHCKPSVTTKINPLPSQIWGLETF